MQAKAAVNYLLVSISQGGGEERGDSVKAGSRRPKATGKRERKSQQTTRTQRTGTKRSTGV